MLPPIPIEERARLACLRSLDILESDPEERFDHLVLVASELTGCPYALISFLDDCRLWFKAKVGLTAGELPREQAFCAYAVGLDAPLIVPDARVDSRFCDHPIVTGPPYVRYYAGFPIRVDGFAIGSICVGDRRRRRLSARKLAALEGLAAQVAALLEAKRSEKRSAVAERRFSAFMHHAPMAAFFKGPDGRMKYVNERFERVFRRKAGEVLGCLDEEWLPEFVVPQVARQDAHIVATGEVVETMERIPDAEGSLHDLSLSKFPVHMEDGVWIGAVALDVTELREARREAQAERDFSEAVINTGGALVCVMDREGRFVRFNAECERVTGLPAAEVLGRPLWETVFHGTEAERAKRLFLGLRPEHFPYARENEWPGADGTRRIIEWRSTALLGAGGELEFVVATGIDITVRRQHEKLLRVRKRELREANARLERLATIDELTRVANRLAFRERMDVEMSRVEREGAPLSLAIVDVDRFKRFNDEFGHGAGDDVLRGVASVLTGLGRELDFVARYGGEEFVVLMPGTGVAEAILATERLREAIASAEWPHRGVTASFGVATLRPGLTGASFVNEADRALYASKAAGRNRVTHALDLPIASAAA